MTFEERMNHIASIPNSRRVAEEEETEKLRRSAEKYTLMIMQKRERIKNLIALFNQCVNCGIAKKEFEKAFRYGYTDNYEIGFCADGFYHYIGFMDNRYDMENLHNTEYIGIYNGGANGVYDFYTDGYYCFMKHEDSKIKGIYMRGDLNNTCRESYIWNARKFLRDFDSFEKAFYSFIDSLT